MKKHFYILGMSLFSTALIAQSQDTLWTATVAGSSIVQTQFLSPVDSIAMQTQTADEVWQYNPRVQLRSYAPGQVVTMGVGGAGSGQTALSWDGIPLNSAATGIVDVSTIPASMVHSGSVQSGATNASAGFGSLLGHIDLSMAQVQKSTLNVALNQNAIGNTGVSIYNALKKEHSSNQFTVQLNNFRNNYSYNYGALAGQVSGMDAEVLSYLHQWKRALGGGDWQTDMWFTGANRSNSGSVLVAGTPSYLTDRNIRVKSSWKRNKGQWQVYWANEVQSFTDSTYGIQDTNGYRGFIAQYAYTAEKFTVGGQMEYHTVYGSNRVGSRPSGTVFLKHKTGRYSTLEAKGALYGITPMWSAKWAAARRLSTNTQGYASVAKNYRMPTLNDLYWTPGGNPDLLPEASWNATAGLKSSGKGLTFTTELSTSYFNNLIQWVPGTGNVWTPVNLQNAWISNIDQSIAWNHGNWNTAVQYSLTLARQNGKQLIYIPVHGAVAKAHYQFTKLISAQGALTIRSARHTLRDNSSIGVLPAEYWVDFQLLYRPSSHLVVQGGAQRLTNVQCSQFQYFPLPSNIIYIQLNLNLKQ